MTTLEQKSRKRGKRRNIQRLILSTVGTVGVLGVGLLAPNIFVVLGKLGLVPKRRHEEIVRSSASRLRKRGLLKFENGYYQLTSEGRKILRHFELVDYRLKKPKKWDKKWRVIIFDIPEKKKKTRDRITMLFRQAGFERLQDSVWVYPYNCEEIIGLLKTDLGVGKYLLYLIVEELENDRSLRETFGLI